MTIYPKLILDALATVRYPGTGKNIVEMGMVADGIRIEANKVSFSLIFQRSTDPFIKSIVKAAEVAEKYYWRIVGKRRSGKIYRGSQFSGFARTIGLQGGPARCRHLRTIGAENVWRGRRTALHTRN